jgi:hypothetical protein
MIRTRIHGNLRASTRHAIRTPGRIATRGQLTTHSRKRRSGGYRCTAREGARNNTAFALGRGEHEAGGRGGGRDGRARAGRVPCSSRDDASLLRAVDLNVEVALTGERSAGRACRRRDNSSDGLGTRGC